MHLAVHRACNILRSVEACEWVSSHNANSGTVTTSNAVTQKDFDLEAVALVPLSPSFFRPVLWVFPSCFSLVLQTINDRPQSVNIRLQLLISPRLRLLQLLQPLNIMLLLRLLDILALILPIP